MLSYPLPHTARLRLRPVASAAAAAMLRVYGDAAVMRYVADGKPRDAAAIAGWQRNIARSYRERGYGLAALCRASLAEPIGFAGLTHPGGQSEAELKYALAPPYWGQGYASEAAAALLDFGLRTVGLARIIATVDTVHTASVQVLDKIGMRRVEERVDAEGYAEFLYERRALAGSP